MPTPTPPKRPAPPPAKSRVDGAEDAVKPPTRKRKAHSYGQSAGGPVPANAKPIQRQPTDAEELAGEPMREEG
jgi:hypothetical protein